MISYQECVTMLNNWLISYFIIISLYLFCGAFVYMYTAYSYVTEHYSHIALHFIAYDLVDENYLLRR